MASGAVEEAVQEAIDSGAHEQEWVLLYMYGMSPNNSHLPLFLEKLYFGDAAEKKLNL